MKKLLFIITIFLISEIYSQNEYVNQVLLLNEGSYDYYKNEILEPVTVGSYNPEDNTYSTIIELSNARFASDLIIYDNYFYVAADNQILKYDLDTYELIAYQNVPGVRKLVVYNDFLIITKGDYNLETYSPVIFDSYVDVYSSNNLEYLLSFDTENGPQWSTENLIVKDEKLYVSINNAYEWGNYKGIIGIIDLSVMEYVNEIDLGEDGKNPINMFLENNNIYTVNNKNWDGSSISVIDLINLDNVTINLSNVSSGCGISIIRDEHLYYQISSDNQVHKFNLTNLEENGVAQNLTYNYYAIAKDPVSDFTYASVANFITDNDIVIYDNNNNIINTFIADVATGKIVFDIRNENVNLLDSSCINNELKVIGVIDYLGRTNFGDDINIILYNDGSVKKRIKIK